MKDSILKLIIQYLHEDHQNISEELRRSEGYEIEEIFPERALKQHILTGRWDLISNELGKLIDMHSTENNGNEYDDFVIKSIFFIIFEQELHEKLRDNKQTEALEILRNKIAPLNLYSDRVQRLATNILEFRKDLCTERAALFEKIFEILKKALPGALIEEKRLEGLMGEALEFEKKTKCPYHYESKKITEDPLHGHRCCKSKSELLESVPDKQILYHQEQGHQEGDNQILNMNLSTDGTRLIFSNEIEAKVIDLRGGSGGVGGIIATFDIQSCYYGASLWIWPKKLKYFPIVLDNSQVVSFLNIQDINAAQDRGVECKAILGNILSVAFFHNFERVVISTMDQITYLVDCKTGNVIHSWIRLRCRIILTPTAGSEYFLAAKDDGNILQISTEEPYETIMTISNIFSGKEKSIIASAFLADEKLLVPVNNSIIYLFDDWQAYQRPTKMFSGYTCSEYRIHSMIIGEDLIVSGSETGSIFIWNVNSGRLLYEMKAHVGCVNDIIQIDPNSREFISCGDDGFIIKWKLP